MMKREDALVIHVEVLQKANHGVKHTACITSCAPVNTSNMARDRSALVVTSLWPSAENARQVKPLALLGIRLTASNDCPSKSSMLACRMPSLSAGNGTNAWHSDFACVTRVKQAMLAWRH